MNMKSNGRREEEMNREEKEIRGRAENSGNVRLSESEYRLMDVIWDREPISAMELSSICLEKFDWKKSTVYTMLKRMGDKGILLFKNKTVTALVAVLSEQL